EPHHLLDLIQDRVGRLEQEGEMLAEVDPALRLLLQDPRADRLAPVVVCLVIENVGTVDLTHCLSPCEAPPRRRAGRRRARPRSSPPAAPRPGKSARAATWGAGASCRRAARTAAPPGGSP